MLTHMLRAGINQTPRIVQSASGTSSVSCSSTGVGILLMFVRQRWNASPAATISGWTLVGDYVGNASPRVRVFWKTNTPGLTSISISGLSPTSIFVELSGGSTVESAGTATNTFSTSPNPPSLTLSQTRSALWFACYGVDTASTFVSSPTNYTTVASTGVSGLAQRTLTAASENPGVFTISPADTWTTATVAVY